MIRMTNALRQWFEENNIPTEGLTLILNFQDAEGGVRFDSAMRREVDRLQLTFVPFPALFDRFKLNGIKVKVESPVHSSSSE